MEDFLFPTYLSAWLEASVGGRAKWSRNILKMHISRDVHILKLSQ